MLVEVRSPEWQAKEQKLWDELQTSRSRFWELVYQNDEDAVRSAGTRMMAAEKAWRDFVFQSP